MNLLIAYLSHSGELTQLTLQEPLTFAFLGALLIVIGLCSLFVPDGAIPGVICFALGFISINYSFCFHLYVTDQEVKAIIVGIIVGSITLFSLIKFIIFYFKNFY
jgi:hypothetical protein